MKDFKLIFPGGLFFVVIRAFALWIYVPLGLISIVFTFPWLLKTGATIGQYLGWIDINIGYLTFKTVLRPFARGIPKFLSWADMSSVTHRIGVLDPY